MFRVKNKLTNQTTRTMIALFIVPIVLVAFVFFYLGKHQERIEWNKLIKDGILPKPKQQEQ